MSLQAWLEFEDADSGDVFYLSDQWFIALETASGPWTYVEGRILNRIRFSDSVQTEIWGGGRGTFGFSELRLDNSDGALSDWATRKWEFVNFYVGDISTAYLVTNSANQLYREIRVRDVEMKDSGTVVVLFESPFQVLDYVLNYSTTFDTGYYPDTLQFAPNAEAPLPHFAGKVYYAPVWLTHDTNLTYDVIGPESESGHAALTTINAAYDRGVELTVGGGNDYTTTNHGITLLAEPDGHVNVTATRASSSTLGDLMTAVKNTAIDPDNGTSGLLGGGWDTSLLTLNSLMGSPEWGYVLTGVYLTDLIQDLADSCSAFVSVEVGTLKMVRLDVPSATPDFEVSEIEIAGTIERARDRAPGLTSRGKMRRNWSPVPPGESATAAESNSERRWLLKRKAGSAYRDGLHPFYEHALTAEARLFFFNDASQGVDELERSLDLYGRMRYFHRVPVQITEDNYQDLFGSDFGDTVRLTDSIQSQLGFEFGTNLVLVGRDMDWTNRRATLRLWGTEGRYRTAAMDFDGTSTYFHTASPGLSTISNGDAVTLCIAFNPDDATPSVNQNLFKIGSDRCTVQVTTTGQIRVRLENSSGTVLADVFSAAAVVSELWNAFLFSCDLSESKFHMYLNGADITPASPSLTNGTIELQEVTRIGGQSVNTNNFEGQICHVSCSGSYVNMDSEAVRLGFFDKYNMPVWPGESGEGPFGFSPAGCWPDGDGRVNIGSGGNLDRYGTAVLHATSSPTNDRGIIDG